jgi:hypothetical protein
LVFDTDGGESLSYAVREIERESHNYFVFDINFSVYIVLKKISPVSLTWEILLHPENIFCVLKFCSFMLQASEAPDNTK